MLGSHPWYFIAPMLARVLGPYLSRIALSLITLRLFTISLSADVTMPSVFGDHMVLQQGVTLPVWGDASPGERVSVMIGDRYEETTADFRGHWRVNFRPIPKSTASFTVVINGNNRLEFRDVLAGDVWICAGEGNMEFPCSQSETGREMVESVSDPGLRLFIAPLSSGDAGKAQVGKWLVCNPENAAGFSAIGYFFGRDLRSSQKIPIGIIQATEQGSPIRSWISKVGLEKAPSVPSASKDFSGKSSTSGLPDPGAIFGSMIEPIIPYAMTGVIWYQGESDEGFLALQYRRLFPRLISDWRERWKQGPFPFFFVSLAGFGSEDGNPVESFLGNDGLPRRSWPWIREGASAALTLPATGMAVASDLGVPDDRYPADKLDVGRRLALLARHRVYGEAVADEGPVFRSVHPEGKKIRVMFDSSGAGLICGASPWQPKGQPLLRGTTPKGFAIAGKDGKWFPASGTIEGESLVLWSESVPDPLCVRYGWRGFSLGNIYNKMGLPAPPFRSDTEQPKSGL
jgi:sialate O-acetylesterase